MKYILMFTMIFYQMLAYPQNRCYLSVRSKENKEGIRFASVVFLQSAYAVNTDVNGSLYLPSNIAFEDSIMISAPGFITVKKFYKSSGGVTLIELMDRKKANSQKPIEEKKRNEVVLNQYDKNKIEYFTGLETLELTSDYLMIAQKITIPFIGAQLKKIRLNRLILKPEDMPPNDTLTKTKFYIRIMDLDSLTNAPGDDIFEERIEVTDLSSKEIFLDVDKYNIFLRNKFFFVVVEFLRIPYNQQLTKINDKGVAFEAPLDSRYKYIYQPFIGMSDYINEQPNIWILDFKGKWKPYLHFSPRLNNLAICVTVQ